MNFKKLGQVFSTGPEWALHSINLINPWAEREQQLASLYATYLQCHYVLLLSPYEPGVKKKTGLT